MAEGDRYADIKTGFSCNNNCMHCVIADKRRDLKGMKRKIDRSTQEVFEQIELAKEDGIRKIVLTGGEILIRDDILDIFRHTKQLDMIVGVQTNGRLLCYEEFTRRLAETCPASYTVALNGPNAEIHDNISRCQGAFSQTVQGIKNLRKYNQRVSGKIVISRYNFQYLTEIVALFHELGVKNINIAFPHGQGNALLYFDDVVPAYTELKPYLDSVIEMSEKLGVWVDFEAVPLCFLAGKEKRAAELRMVASQLRDMVGINPSYEKTRKNIAKAKGPNCKQCRYEHICEGPWVEYPQRRGFDEFKAVPGKKITSLPPDWLSAGD